MTTAQDSGKVVSLTHRPPLPQEVLLYSFLLQAESTPGPYCDRKDFISMKNSNDTSWDFLLFSFVYIDSFYITEHVTLILD